jgi:type II secretory pathway pseudopilin PulG
MAELNKRDRSRPWHLWLSICSIALLVIVGSAVAIIAKQRNDRAKAVAAKQAHDKEQAYISKLQRVVNDSNQLDGLLYDTAARYPDDQLAEQQALQDIAEINGEISGSSDTPLLSSILAQGRVITKAVCQCSSDLTSRSDLLAAYDAEATLKTDISELKGRIATLRGEQ